MNNNKFEDAMCILDTLYPYIEKIDFDKAKMISLSSWKLNKA